MDNVLALDEIRTLARLRVVDWYAPLVTVDEMNRALVDALPALAKLGERGQNDGRMLGHQVR
jgi:hypothetical protein